jgi:hypothetical protein
MPGIRSRGSWLVAEHLPPYAPDLNPVETLWEFAVAHAGGGDQQPQGVQAVVA